MSRRRLQEVVEGLTEGRINLRSTTVSSVLVGG